MATCPTCRATLDDDLAVCPHDGTPLGTVMIDPMLGVALGGRYLLREGLASRGRFRVYGAEEQGTGRAVLVTLTEREVDERTFDRFRSLSEELGSLDHPCCSRIADFGRTPEGVLYLVEEGELWHQLAQDLDLKGRLPAATALDLGVQLLEGLDHLHGLGRVHGSLAPAALRLSFGADGALRLQIPASDIPCRAVDPEGEASDRAYAAPRGVEGVAADLHAAALITLRMLTGTLPGQGQRELPDLGALGLDREQTQRLEGVLRRGLALEVQRYSTAGEMLRDLQALTGRSRLGRYHLQHQIGEGGMGEVYLARAEGVEGVGFDRLCVIKTIRTGLANDPQFVERFLAEARVLSSLSHGNIVPVYDVGKVGTTFYIVMEYVVGKDLRAVLARAAELGRRLPVPLALFIARELANGLAYAHRATVRGGEGLVHRDVSPHNVLVSYEGEVRLIDFGLAQWTTPTGEEGMVVGKLCYLSPEQARAQPLDRRTDIYSAGLVLFELLCGEPFFNQGSVREVLARVARPELVPPSARTAGIPPEVDRICLRAMAPDREERYATAAELRDDLAAELARIAPRTNPEEVGAFLRDIFPTEEVEQRRVLTDLSITLPPEPGPLLGGGSGMSLLHREPTPIQLASTVVEREEPRWSTPGPGRPRSPTSRPRQPWRRAVLPLGVGILVAATTAAVMVQQIRSRHSPPSTAALPAARPDTGVAARAGGGEVEEPLDDQDSGEGDLAVPDASARRARRPTARPQRPPHAGPCFLQVVGGPRGARVTVDGAERARLPLSGRLELQPGVEHRVAISRPGLVPFRTRLTCRPNEIVRIRTGVR